MSYNWLDVGKVLESAHWWSLWPIPFILILNFGLRAFRWQWLFPVEFRPRYAGAFVALMSGYLFNNILPARAGEFVRMHIVGRREQLPRSTALGTLVTERTMDLMVLLALLVTVLYGQSLPAWAGYAAKVISLISMVAFVILIVLGWKGSKGLDILISRIPLVTPSVKSRIQVSGKAFIDGVSAVFHLRHFALFVLVTAAIWLLEIAVVWCVSEAFALPLGFLQVLFVMLITALGTMVPASPGYVGTFEFFGLQGLKLIGVTGGNALGFVVVLHTVLFLGSSIVGAVCFAFNNLARVRGSTSVL